jgi:hypothetical protein
MVAERLLEVDAEDRFCWSGGLMVVMPRQLGKSTLMSMLALWLAHDLGRVVVSTSDTLRTTDKVQAPWRRWATEAGFKAKARFDQPEIDFGRGRWTGQAANEHLGVGMTVDAGLVDEAWDVPEVAVTRALAPAMSAVPSPLLLLTSTASVGRSPLMDRYRAAAERGARNVGLVEWAAPDGADWRDEDAWRQAHPHWTPQRLDYLRQQVQVLPPEDFQSQYLCIPQDRKRRTDAQPLIAADVLHGLRRVGVQPSGHVVGAVEDWHGRESGAALAWMDDDQVVVVGKRFERLEQSFAWVARYANEVLVGLMFRDHPQAQQLGATGVGTRETVKALPLLRRLAAEGKFAWDGDDLADQLVPLRVAEKDGVLKIVEGSHFIARPAAWAVMRHVHAPAVAPSVF